MFYQTRLTHSCKGLALSLWLELQVTISKPSAASALNCVITCEGQGAEEIEVDPSHNLITRTALYVLRCHHQPVFPPETHVHIINDIFLGRGLGSSGAAVVAGVMLGNALGKCGMSKQRMLDYCLIFERHPDNVAAALFGGFVGTYLSPSNPEEVVKGEIPRSEVLPNTASEVSPQSRAPESPPEGIGHHIKFRWAPEIKVLVIVPNFEGTLVSIVLDFASGDGLQKLCHHVVVFSLCRTFHYLESPLWACGKSQLGWGWAATSTPTNRQSVPKSAGLRKRH